MKNKILRNAQGIVVFKIITLNLILENQRKVHQKSANVFGQKSSRISSMRVELAGLGINKKRKKARKQKKTRTRSRNKELVQQQKKELAQENTHS